MPGADRRRHKKTGKWWVLSRDSILTVQGDVSPQARPVPPIRRGNIPHVCRVEGEGGRGEEEGVRE